MCGLTHGECTKYRGVGEFRLRDAGLVLGWSVEPQSGLGRNRDYKVGGMHGGKIRFLIEGIVKWDFLAKLKEAKGLKPKGKNVSVNPHTGTKYMQAQ